MSAAKYDQFRECWQAGADGEEMPTCATEEADEDAYDALRMWYCLGAEGVEWDEDAAREEAGL